MYRSMRDPWRTVYQYCFVGTFFLGSGMPEDFTLDLNPLATLTQGISQYSVSKINQNLAEVTMHETKHKYPTIRTVMGNW